LPPVHPRGIFLPDITALGEAHPVQFGGIAFEPQRRAVAEFGATLGDAERQPVRLPPFVGPLAFVRRRQPALAELGQARIDDAEVAFRRPMDTDRVRVRW
jgi:hypothetical protein